MYTSNYGKTRFHYNSDLSGNVMITNAPAVKEGETDDRQSIETPANDIVLFVIDRLKEKLMDKLTDRLDTELYKDYQDRPAVLKIVNTICDLEDLALDFKDTDIEEDA